MSDLKLTKIPAVKVGLLMRTPPERAFEAIADPSITTNFWYTKSSGRMTSGANLRWEWEMYGLSIQVQAKVVEPNRRIVYEWGVAGEAPTTVEWTLTARPDGTTAARVTNSGFTGDADAIVRSAIDSAGGFSLVIAGLKAWLEHGIQLNLVADRHPDGLGEG